MASDKLKIDRALEFMDEAFEVTSKYFEDQLDLNSREGKALIALTLVIDQVEEILRG